MAGAFESDQDYVLYSTQYNSFMILLRVAKSYSPDARRFIEDLIERKGSHILKELNFYREHIRWAKGCSIIDIFFYGEHIRWEEGCSIMDILFYKERIRWAYRIRRDCGAQIDTFLDAFSHLYKRLCPSVGRSVGRLVGWSLFTFFYSFYSY